MSPNPPLVLRFDFAGKLRKAERIAAGGYRVRATIARVGILEYPRIDGGVREYFPPEELGRASSLATLRDAPVTVGHPDMGGRMVDPTTYRGDSVGHVSGSPTIEGDLLVAELAVLDADAIARIDAGELVELSCGYTCSTRGGPGTTPGGERYDRIQCRREYNHIALLREGEARAGRDARLRLDAVTTPNIHHQLAELRFREAAGKLPRGFVEGAKGTKTGSRPDPNFTSKHRRNR